MEEKMLTHKRRIEQMELGQKAQREYEENLRKKDRQEAEKLNRRMIEQIRQEQKLQQEQYENLRKNSYKKLKKCIKEGLKKINFVNVLSSLRRMPKYGVANIV